jgi:hypothetical protein
MKFTQNTTAGLTMLFIGIAYAIAPQVGLIGQIVSFFGQIGLYIFCFASIICGIFTFRHPKQHTFILTLPLLFYLGITVSIYETSLTAMIYYLSLWLFPNLTAYYRNRSQNQSNLRIYRIIDKITWHRLFFAIHLAMFVVLIIKPDGRGLQFIYDNLSFMDDPVTFYRILFGFSTLMLLKPFYPFGKSVSWIYLYCFPILLHGGLFIVRLLFETGALAFLPAFIGNSLIWLHAIERATTYD